MDTHETRMERLFRWANAAWAFFKRLGIGLCEALLVAFEATMKVVFSELGVKLANDFAKVITKQFSGSAVAA